MAILWLMEISYLHSLLKKGLGAFIFFLSKMKAIKQMRVLIFISNE